MKKRLNSSIENMIFRMWIPEGWIGKVMPSCDVWSILHANPTFWLISDHELIVVRGAFFW